MKFLPFSALFHTFDHFPELFALLNVFRTFWHLFVTALFCTNFSIKVGSSFSNVSWKVIEPIGSGKFWYRDILLGKFWYCELESNETGLESFGQIMVFQVCTAPSLFISTRLRLSMNRYRFSGKR